MKYKFLYILIFLPFGCTIQPASPISNPKAAIKLEPQNPIDSLKKNQIRNLKSLSLINNNHSYEETKRDIENQLAKLKSLNLNLDSISKIFKTSLVNRIIPYWEGTTWSFEGHTSEPKKGEIACGYFVSTTLRDVGLNINRYKLAQQSPVNEARSLAVSSAVHTISKNTTIEKVNAINEILEPGIHFIGLDQSHVGYILKEKDLLYLIHSNYLEPHSVEIELLEDSEVFKSYSKFYIVELSSNKELMTRWLNTTEIETIKSQ